MDTAPTTRPSLLIRLRDPADECAWAEFVDIYGPLLQRLARGRGLQHADAEDLAQEVFRVVAAAIEGGRYDPSRGSFRGWLFRIAHNLTLKSLVARGRQPRGSGDTGVLNFLEEQPAPAPEDSAQFEAAYRRRMLEWAARKVRGEFSELAWHAFLATGVEARPAADVARELGIKVGSVYNLKCRVMARLRREIEQVQDAESAGF
ncbi:RNA polymerase sigma-70 factor, ECF subfamily [Singulisphaera sp. GP187]|uniref:RNA polymerase sigma factor n=1 Tax=Singulisphaera sp. GP187 TaxID=1882752 RepID=UPI000928CB4B|nr:sigma-70 family RNA polymerase sigma factor [Singulisphaera sp. GP187]SIO43439.1 RNA polymerase sigma-70 factor, ECF subfamily [Singulisphaera sp. GP187]